jgi:electron transport complex protein RnfG
MSLELKMIPSRHLPALTLGAFALVCAILLALANEFTRNEIIQRQKEDLQNSLRQVIPPDRYDNDLVASTIEIADKTIYLAKKAGEITAVAFNVSEPGYGGTIKLVMGVDMAGNILGVRVISHSETPGLGDKIEVRKHTWIRGFDGRSLSEPKPDLWAVKKDGGVFDQFSGATITPRAIVKAVKDGLVFFMANRENISDTAP